MSWDAPCRSRAEGSASLFTRPLLEYNALEHPAPAHGINGRAGDILVALPTAPGSHTPPRVGSPTLVSRSRSSALPCKSRSPGVFGLDTFTTR